jgi:uncharacterized protein
MASANAEIVQKFISICNTGDLDAGFTLLTDDATWSIAQRVRGIVMAKAEVRVRMGAMRAAFEEPLQLRPFSIIEQGNRLVVECESFAKTIEGKTYENKYCIFFTVQGGKITEVKEYNDSLHVTQVLLPAMERARGRSQGR